MHHEVPRRGRRAGADLNVGILGGTFNPPHIGHLLCAQEAHAQLGLDVVLFMVAAVPPHKRIEADPGAAERVALVRAAIAGDDRFAVCELELGRAGPSFTVDTLRALHERAPQDELTFIVGADQAQALPAWREPAQVLAQARLGVAGRDGVAREDLRERLAPLHDGTRVVFFDMPRIDVSSSLVRRRAAAGRPLRYLVPDAVAERIAAAGLYAGAVPGVPA